MEGAFLNSIVIYLPLLMMLDFSADDNHSYKL